MFPRKKPKKINRTRNPEPEPEDEQRPRLPQAEEAARPRIGGIGPLPEFDFERRWQERVALTEKVNEIKRRKAEKVEIRKKWKEDEGEDIDRNPLYRAGLEKTIKQQRLKNLAQSWPVIPFISTCNNLSYIVEPELQYTYENDFDVDFERQLQEISGGTIEKYITDYIKCIQKSKDPNQPRKRLTICFFADSLYHPSNILASPEYVTMMKTLTDIIMYSRRTFKLAGGRLKLIRDLSNLPMVPNPLGRKKFRGTRTCGEDVPDRIEKHKAYIIYKWVETYRDLALQDVLLNTTYGPTLLNKLMVQFEAFSPYTEYHEVPDWGEIFRDFVNSLSIANYDQRILSWGQLQRQHRFQGLFLQGLYWVNRFNRQLLEEDELYAQLGEFIQNHLLPKITDFRPHEIDNDVVQFFTGTFLATVNNFIVPYYEKQIEMSQTLLETLIGKLYGNPHYYYTQSDFLVLNDPDLQLEVPLREPPHIQYLPFYYLPPQPTTCLLSRNLDAMMRVPDARAAARKLSFVPRGPEDRKKLLFVNPDLLEFPQIEAIAHELTQYYKLIRRAILNHKMADNSHLRILYNYDYDPEHEQQFVAYRRALQAGTVSAAMMKKILKILQSNPLQDAPIWTSEAKKRTAQMIRNRLKKWFLLYLFEQSQLQDPDVNLNTERVVLYTDLTIDHPGARPHSDESILRYIISAVDNYPNFNDSVHVVVCDSLLRMENIRMYSNNEIEIESINPPILPRPEGPEGDPSACAIM